MFAGADMSCGYKFIGALELVVVAGVLVRWLVSSLKAWGSDGLVACLDKSSSWAGSIMVLSGQAGDRLVALLVPCCALCLDDLWASWSPLSRRSRSALCFVGHSAFV